MVSRWEIISNISQRIKVPGGWLIESKFEESCALIFISDPHWEWEIAQ